MWGCEAGEGVGVSERGGCGGVRQGRVWGDEAGEGVGVWGVAGKGGEERGMKTEE